MLGFALAAKNFVPQHLRCIYAANVNIMRWNTLGKNLRLNYESSGSFAAWNFRKYLPKYCVMPTILSEANKKHRWYFENCIEQSKLCNKFFCSLCDIFAHWTNHLPNIWPYFSHCNCMKRTLKTEMYSGAAQFSEYHKIITVSSRILFADNMVLKNNERVHARVLLHQIDCVSCDTSALHYSWNVSKSELFVCSRAILFDRSQ